MGEITQERIFMAVRAASIEFWKVILENFPEVNLESYTFNEENISDLKNTMENSVNLFLKQNCKSEMKKIMKPIEGVAQLDSMIPIIKKLDEIVDWINKIESKKNEKN